MKVAALDLGSNTFLCLIAEVHGGRIEQVYDDQVRMVRLGQDMAKTGYFHPQALERASAALADFAVLIAKEKPERILAMATSAARDAKNKDELFALGEKYQIPIEIIPGGREAEITFAGSVSGLERPRETPFLVVDVGGGSTEFIFGRKGDVPRGQSLDLGCVRMKDTAAGFSLSQIRQEIREQFAFLQIGSAEPGTEVIAVAGTPTELVRMELGSFDPKRIEGFVLNQDRLNEWVEVLAKLPAEKITAQFGTHPGRADVILYGALILSETLPHFGARELTVSVRGVRYGVALEIERRATAT